jgi:conjugal transfer mating pair stabilization protein TraG
LGGKGTVGLGGDVGTPGKGILGSGIKGRGDLSGSLGYQHQWTQGDNAAQTNSDAQSASDSRNAAHYQANGQDVTLTDGGYWRNGTFHRIENFAERRQAIEKDFSAAQSLERQASQSDDTGTRLERIASMSQSSGWQLSDDMSQVIASRYNQMAHSPEFRDLGAPALTKTDVSPHQREVRSMIVSRVLQDYAASGLSEVQAQIKDPVSERGAVHGPDAIHVPTHMPSMPRGMPSVGREGGSVPGQQEAQDTIAAGTRGTATQAAKVKGAFSNRSVDGDKDDAEIKGRVK